MKRFPTPKAIVAAVLCYAATIITFSSFLVEAVYAHSSSGSSTNNHEHGIVISVSELLLQFTPFTAGLVIGFLFLFWEKEMINKFRWNTNPRT